MYVVKMLCYDKDSSYEDEPCYNPANKVCKIAFRNALNCADEECKDWNFTNTDKNVFYTVELNEKRHSATVVKRIQDGVILRYIPMTIYTVAQI